MSNISQELQRTMSALHKAKPGTLVAIVGPPASGKTTLAMWVAQEWPGTLVSLSEALSGSHPGPGSPTDALLIADGLDELAPVQAEKVIRLLAQVRNSRVLVTTRPAFALREDRTVIISLNGEPGGLVPTGEFGVWQSTLSRFRTEGLLSTDLGLDLIFAPPLADEVELRGRTSLLGPDGSPLDGNHEFALAHFAHVTAVSEQLLKWLADDPERMKNLDDRRFEEVVAELLTRQGYEVELTPAKRDGGRDIHAAHHTDLGQFLYFVECKQWTRPVEVDVVRSLYGVVQAEGATAGIVATTSRFTKGAYEFEKKVRWHMSLRDLAALGKWLAVVQE